MKSSLVIWCRWTEFVAKFSIGMIEEEVFEVRLIVCLAGLNTGRFVIEVKVDKIALGTGVLLSDLFLSTTELNLLV